MAFTITKKQTSSGGGSGEASNSFSIIQPDLGTSPTASSPTDILNLTSETLSITGDSSTDTVSFELNSTQSLHQLTLGVGSTEGTTKLTLQALTNTEKLLEGLASNGNTAFVMQMFSNGPRLGVNVTPNAALHVNSGSSNTGIRLQSTTPDAVFAVQDSTANSGTPPYFGGRGNNHIIGRGANIRMFIQDSNGNIGIGTDSPNARLHSIGSTIVGCATSEVSDSSMGNSQVNFWVDETANTLNFKVKYSNGTVRSGSVTLS